MSDNTTILSVTADEVVALYRIKKDLQESLEAIDVLIKERARALAESGADLLSSDGIKVSYSESTRRDIMPELVQMKFPEVYARIMQEQIASYKPKLTLSLLSRHMPEEDIMSVVSVSEPMPMVRFIEKEV